MKDCSDSAWHFIDDEDLVAIACGSDAEALDDHLAHVVHTGMRRGIDLDDVDVPSLGDLHAGIARAARVGRGAGLAVERPREDARGGRLADAPGTREDERLGDTPALDGVAQGLRDPHLPDDIVEALGTPLAGEHLIGAGHWCRGRCSRRPSGRRGVAGVNPTATRSTHAHGRIPLALLPSGPDAVRGLALHRLRTAVRATPASPLV